MLVPQNQGDTTRGPYALGGYCLGGLFAYELASQLRAAGGDVSLLVLLDAPNPSRMEYCDSLGRKARYFKYLLGRAARLGPRTSFTLLRQRLSNRFRNAIPDAFKGLEGTALRRLEAAALAYRPGRYDGRVLLLLGADHPPHVDLLSGWQDVIGQGLNARYMDAHHLDFMRIEKIPAIADAILADLSALNGASSRSSQVTALETCGGGPVFQRKSALNETQCQRHGSE